MRLSVTCYVLLDARLKWRENAEHLFVATSASAPQLYLG